MRVYSDPQWRGREWVQARKQSLSKGGSLPLANKDSGTSFMSSPLAWGYEWYLYNTSFLLVVQGMRGRMLCVVGSNPARAEGVSPGSYNGNDLSLVHGVPQRFILDHWSRGCVKPIPRPSERSTLIISMFPVLCKERKAYICLNTLFVYPHTPFWIMRPFA
jgi:hypothetical protein